MVHGDSMGTTVADTDYRRGVDLARFLAAVGIVWDHSRSPFADIGYTALALFLVLTAFFAVESYGRAEARGKADGFWAARAKRILIPWLFWCAFYKALQYYVADDPSQVPLISDPWSLLLGSWIHLWFLPFVMIALLIVPPVSQIVRGPVALWAFGALIVAIGAGSAWLHRHSGMPEPWPQWWFSIPLFLMGALIALSRRQGMPVVPWVVGVAGTVAMWAAEPGFGATLPAPVSTNIGGPWFASLQLIIVVAVFELVWRLPIRGAWPTWLAGFAFGIYVLHPFMMLVAFKLFGPFVDRPLAFAFTLAAAWLFTAAMQRLPGLRAVV
jgi:peptidoglycan/LPS O-acetylase OafA/YrhL